MHIFSQSPQKIIGLARNNHLATIRQHPENPQNEPIWTKSFFSVSDESRTIACEAVCLLFRRQLRTISQLMFY